MRNELPRPHDYHPSVFKHGPMHTGVAPFARADNSSHTPQQGQETQHVAEASSSMQSVVEPAAYGSTIGDIRAREYLPSGVSSISPDPPAWSAPGSAAPSRYSHDLHDSYNSRYIQGHGYVANQPSYSQSSHEVRHARRYFGEESLSSRRRSGDSQYYGSRHSYQGEYGAAGQGPEFVSRPSTHPHTSYSEAHEGGSSSQYYPGLAVQRPLSKEMQRIPNRSKRMWTPEEDEKLRIVAGPNPENWNQIGEMLPGRTGKQCRERWLNNLRPDIRKGEWSQEEDDLIIREQAKVGNHWSSIARMLPGRSDNAVKNRYNATLRKRQQSRQPTTPTTP